MLPSKPVSAGDHRTRDTGLTAAEVDERVARGQVNATDDTTSRSIWQIVRANVMTRFNAILGALFVLVISTGSWADGLFGVVLIVNSGIGITQEYLAKRKLDSLALLNAPITRVLRDGQLHEIPTAEVVLHDLIELRTGDQVPADGRLYSAAGLEIDESNLTGESDAVPKSSRDTVGGDPVGGDPGDTVLSGTVVVAGSGRFQASAVGADAYANKIAAQARRFTRTRSEIQDSVDKLLKYITWVIVVALPLQIWAQYRANADQGWREVIIRSTGGLVGLVPEGLVLLTSVAFLLAAVQLTRQQVLVQELVAVEGLARVDVVCLDKTGTLTVGDIVFEEIIPIGDIDEADLRIALGALADDPNANGTLKALAGAIPAPAEWVRSAGIAFNSARKWSAATFEGQKASNGQNTASSNGHNTASSNGHNTWVLGAPDMLLDVADPLRARVAEYATTGRRVLLLSNCTSALTGQELPPGRCSQALVVLSEQVRPDAAETLAYFRDQGVGIKIISGDSTTTVAAIARRVGLEFGDDGVVDGNSFGTDPAELAELAERTTVFGRVSPEQKRALVQALQAGGHVVAMTGDGVNDALALKDADIGVAMGNGAQATKSVAQLVLLDGRFSHLPAVLAEGRRVIGNVERVANLFVAKNVMSFLAIVTAAAFALPFPFLPRQLTLVSAVTIGIPAFFLALGPNQRRYVPGFLRRVLRFAVPAGAIAGIVVIVSYLLGRNHYGATGSCSIDSGTNTACSQPGTGATIALLATFFWIVVVLARPFLLWKAALIGSMAGLAALAFVLPAGREFFGFDLPFGLFLESMAVGVAGAIAVELVYRMTPQMRPAAH